MFEKKDAANNKRLITAHRRHWSFLTGDTDSSFQTIYDNVNIMSLFADKKIELGKSKSLPTY